MRKRHPVQNLYSSQLDAAVQAIWSTWDRLDIFKINVVTPPSTDSWWIFLDFENPDKRDLIFYHSKTGNELSYYRMNRDLLGNGANNVTHTKGASVRMNDVGEWMNYISQNIDDFWTVEQRGNWLNVIKVYWGKIAYNQSNVSVADTLLTLADGTWNIIYDFTAGTIQAVTTVTAPWLLLATVTVVASVITNITDVRTTAQANSFSTTFFDVSSWTLIIKNLSIGTAQIANNSVTDAKLTNSGAAAGIYWDATSYPVVTVNAKGRVTNMSTLPLPTLLYAYVHTQWVAATTWNINHNLNTTDLVFAIFDATNEAIVPDTFTIVDADNVTITFTWAIDGKAVLTVVWGSLAGAAWGTITGTLSTQVDLQNALNAKQDTLPLTTPGDMLIRNALNADDRLPLGTANRVLQSNGTIPAYGIFAKVWTTAAMAGTSLIHADADATTTSIIWWTASGTPNGFIQVVPTAGNITFTSTVAETVSFTYSLIKA